MPSLRAPMAALVLTGLISLIGWVPADLSGDRAPEGEKGEGKRYPSEWFLVQRTWPGREIPPESRSLALEQARALRDLAGERGTRGSAWSLAGPTNIGGRITAISSSSGGARIFAGAAAGGVFRSTDSGVTWVPVFDAVGVPSIGALAQDPSNPNTVYAGTGEANSSGDSFDGEGLFRSEDGGDTWSPLGLEATRHIARVVIDPTDTNRLFVAAMGRLFSPNSERGVYRSTNGGVSFDRVLFVSDTTGCSDVVLDPSNPSRVYAAMWERIRRPKARRVGGVTSGIHRSTDGGNTWSLLAGGLPAPANNVGRIGLAISASNPQVIYAIYADDPGNFLGLWKSTNGGDSWTRTNDGALGGMFSSYGWYFANVRVSPTDANRVFALGLDVWRSTNGGSSWSTISSGVHVDQHDLWIDPSATTRMVLGSDGGAYRTTNTGSTWAKAQGLPISQFYAGTIDPSNPERLYGGLQDNGTVRTMTGALDDWEEIYGGDGFYCLVDPRNSNHIYAEYQYGGLGKSTDGGFNFNDATTGINGADRRNWSTPVVMDPENPDRLFYGTYRLWRSTNAAATWSAVSGDLTGGPGGGNLVFGTITTIAVAPSDGQRLYVGTDDARVWTSSNGGGAWQNVSFGLPGRWVTRVVVDPNDPLRALVAQSGYRQDAPFPHLHRTTNAGANWIPIDLGLPEAPINAVVLDPDQANTIYAGTDVGVYVSRDDGASWEDLAPGLPITVVHDLMLDAPTRTLVAATHGRSMYALTLASPSAVLDSAPESGVRWIRVSPDPVHRGERLDIRFEAREGTRLQLALHDAAGRRVRDVSLSPNTREVTLSMSGNDGGPLASGVYFLRLSAGSEVAVRRVTLLP